MILLGLFKYNIVFAICGFLPLLGLLAALLPNLESGRRPAA